MGAEKDARTAADGKGLRKQEGKGRERMGKAGNG